MVMSKSGVKVWLSIKKCLQKCVPYFEILETLKHFAVVTTTTPATRLGTEDRSGLAKEH